MAIISGGAIFESSGFTIALSMGSAYQNVPYSATVVALGGIAPYTFSIISGSLPTGLSLNTSTGVISGTPSGTGLSSFTLQVVDSNSASLSLSTSITTYALTGVGPCGIAVCVNVGTGSLMENSNLQMLTTGYFSDGSAIDITPLASYSCISGSGCTGSTISSTGLFASGSTAGSATVQASFDSVNGTGSITVTSSTIVNILYPTTTLPNGQQYQLYSEGVTGDVTGQGVQILASGGIAPYTCSLSSGSLPTGLALSNIAGNTNCLIGGTPTSSGAGSSFTIEVQDSASNSSTVTISGGIAVVSLASLAVNLAQSTIVSNTSTNASALGMYSDSSTAMLPNTSGANFVQKSFNDSCAAGTTCATTASNATTGNTIVVLEFSGANTSQTTLNAPTDTAGNTYVALTSPTGTTSGYAGVSMWVAANITGNAANVVTCNQTSATHAMYCGAYEYSGISTNPIDQQPTPTEASTGTSCTPNSATTTQANEVGVGVCVPSSATSITTPATYTSRDTAGGEALYFDEVYTTIQTGITPSPTFTPSGKWSMSFATLKSISPAAGGAVWSSATPSCAVISSAGLITAQPVLTSCTSVITATVGATSNTATITVIPSNSDTGIIIVPANATIPIGQNQQFQAQGNNTQNIYSAAWGSNNTAVATINSSSGLASCVAQGTATISAAVSGFTSSNTNLTCSAAGIATIDWTNRHQIIDGFGAANANDGGLNQNLTSAQFSLFFGTGAGQLGFSILRTRIPNNSTGPDAGNCSTVGGTGCVGTLTTDYASAVNAGVRIYSSPWSPPAAYKTNSSTQGGALAAASYANFATWLSNFCASWKSVYGVYPYAISVQNEPDESGSFTSCGWTAAEFDTFIKTNLGPTFSTNSIPTLIFEPEVNNYYNHMVSYGGTCATDASCYGYLGGFNFHEYGGSIGANYSVSDTPYPAGWVAGKKYWQTEASCDGSSQNFCGSGFNATIADGLNWAAVIDQRLAVDNLNAWLWWWLLIPSTATAAGQGLMTSDTSVVAPRAYVMGQYSKFIRPGYYRIDATHVPQPGLTVSAYQNVTSETLVVVATNYTTAPITQTFTITNSPFSFNSVTPYTTSSGQNLQVQTAITGIVGNSFAATLPAQSITTFVGNGSVVSNTYTAASCSQVDVNQVINNTIAGAGTPHLAVDGDTILIPAGNCTWTTGITVPASIGITIQGAGTLNTLASQTGAGTPTTTITDNRSNGSRTPPATPLIAMSPIAGNSLSRISSINFTPYDTTGATAYYFITFVNGTCNSGGCPNLRLDNIVLNGAYGQGSVTHVVSNKDGYFFANNMFGVADHNTLGDANHGGWIFMNINHGSYLGVGQYGDNSWATPDSFGSNNAFYLENNLSYNFNLVDTGISPGGGARYVCRFNQQFLNSQSANTITAPLCAGHGTETGGRTLRGTRQVEGYANTVSCSGNCDDVFGFRSATGRMFGNTYTGSVGYNYAADVQAQRRFRTTGSQGANSFGMCCGAGPFDTNDGITYYSGTVTSVPTPGKTFVADVTPTVTGANFPYTSSTIGSFSFFDVTGNGSGTWGTEMASATSNSITASYWNNFGQGENPANSDSVEILRATICLDQPGRGMGLLVENTPPVLQSTGMAGPVNQVLDPIYFVAENVLTPFVVQNTNKFVFPYSGSGGVTGGIDGTFQYNRDYYTPLTGQTAQTSTTAPFNGTATQANLASVGVGWGPISRRPPTCTTGAAYFATDQGNWNTAGSTFGASLTTGVLYICAANAWPSTPTYVPYTYPHPLDM